MSHEIEKVLHYKFRNKELLEEALTHPSISKQKSHGEGTRSFNYERLEFLGDSVLGLVIAELLINKYPYEKEGHLAKRQAGLVRGEAVAKVARKLTIGKFIKMTNGEETMGGRENSSNIENSLEAIIGAIYLDTGLSEARQFISQHWTKLLDDMVVPPKDAKTALQEWAQGKGLPIPEYKIVNISGPSHQPIFEIEVVVEGLELVKAQGNSKKRAEKDAAKLLLAMIKDKNE